MTLPDESGKVATRIRGYELSGDGGGGGGVVEEWACGRLYSGVFTAANVSKRLEKMDGDILRSSSFVNPSLISLNLLSSLIWLNTSIPTKEG